MNEQMTPDDMFAAPGSRRPPERLRQRILDEIAGADLAERVERPSRLRWLAPLVAASLVAAALGGSLVLRHDRRAPAHQPGKSWSPSPDLLKGAELRKACDELVQREHPGFTFTLQGPAGYSVLYTNGGRGQVCVNDGDRVVVEEVDKPALCPSGAFDGGKACEEQRNHTPTVRSSRGATTIAAAGRLPVGATSAFVTSVGPAAAGHGWWLVDRVVDDAAVAEQPELVVVRFSSAAKGKAGGSRVFGWPGTDPGARTKGKDLVAQCTARDVTKGRAVAATHLGSRGTGVVVVFTDGSFLGCAGSDGGVVSTSDSPPQTSSLGGFRTITAIEGGTSIGLVVGRVPPGVDRISITSPNGREDARTEGGYWVWEDPLTSRQVGYEPEHLWVEMSGNTPRSAWLPWFEGGGEPGASWLPRLAAGEGFARSVAPASTRRIQTAQGHVVLLFGRVSKLIAFGVGEMEARAHTEGSVTPDAFSLVTRRVARQPGLVFAGGVAPAGVTSVVFHSSGGSLPATVEQGHWVFEQQFLRDDASARPRSVTVTRNGQPTTLQLP